jgi:hypothetical protein
MMFASVSAPRVPSVVIVPDMVAGGMSCPSMA